MLQLRVKANTHQGPSKISDSRQVVENARSKLVQSLSAEYRSSGSPDAVSMESPESDGLQALSRIQRRLRSMKSGKLKTSLDLVDKVARVC